WSESAPTRTLPVGVIPVTVIGCSFLLGQAASGDRRRSGRQTPAATSTRSQAVAPSHPTSSALPYISLLWTLMLKPQAFGHSEQRPSIVRAPWLACSVPRLEIPYTVRHFPVPLAGHRDREGTIEPLIDPGCLAIATIRTNTRARQV